MATTLKQGSRGDEVKTLQNYLISHGYDVGSSGADGIFGANTAAAVRKFQQDKGLTVDGIVGPQTWGAINTPTSPAPFSNPSNTRNATKIDTNIPSGLIRSNPLTGEQIKAQAENYINPLYNAERESLIQATDRAKLAYQNQLAARQNLYELQKQDVQELAGQQRQRASDNALKRGLARSSIAMADLGRVDTAEMKSLENLQRNLETDLNNIQSQISLLETQLADSLKRLDIDKAVKIQARIDELAREQEAKQIEITQLNNQYLQNQQAFEYQKQRDTIADQQWQQQFDWNKYMDQQRLALSRASGGGGSSKSSVAKVDPFDKATQEQRNKYNYYYNALIANRKPNWDPLTIYKNIQGSQRDIYKAELGPLYDVFLADAQAAAEAKQKQKPAETPKTTYGEIISDYQLARDKNKWLQTRLPYMTNDEVEFFYKWLKDNQSTQHLVE